MKVTDSGNISENFPNFKVCFAWIYGKVDLHNWNWNELAMGDFQGYFLS